MNTVVSAALSDYNQPPEDQEAIALVHGGTERFALIEIPEVAEGSPVVVTVRATGFAPHSLIAVLRSLADGLEANVPAG